MKTAIVLAAAAALVAAEPQHALPSGTKINCAKANANYCMGGDIILRCGPDATGEPARCSANVSGYPPAGGIAECWESSRDAGDAACQKNCVVYAEKPFTLPADQCTPSATQTGQPTSTGSSSASASSSSGTGSSTSSTATGGTGTSHSSSVTTLPPPPVGGSTITTRTSGNSTVTPPGPSRGSTITLTTTAGPKPTTVPPPNANDGVANKAMGGLLALGLAAAALF